VILRGVRFFRLLRDAPRHGQENMAIDEALLESVGDGRSPPTLRLYGFAPPTLSLGRFQKAGELIDRQALERDRLILVRRPTGGQAVLHDRELTYGVLLAREHLEPFGKREIYRFIADLLLAGLEAIGIRGRSSLERRGSPHNPDCFRATGQYEIADLGERKLIGSAQVLSRRAALQHGAIPLDGSYRRISRYLRSSGEEDHGQPASLGEELGREVGFAEAQEAFGRGAALALRKLGPALEPGELSPAELARSAELLAEKYSRDEWNLAY
jgi:lipoate-protein ligase A